jgi:outer membrane protein TolC
MAHFSRSLSSLLFAATFSWGSAASADTLLEIYELALKNDPVLKSAEASFRAGREAEVQGRSALLPQVGAQVAVIDEFAQAAGEISQVTTPEQETGGPNRIR